MSKKYLRQRRIFSVSLRKQVVKEIETNKLSVSQASREYQVSRGAIYQWIHKYSHYNQKGARLVVDKQSHQHKLEDLRKRIKELEQALGHNQMKLDYYETLMKLAEEELDIDIKKNFGTERSGDSAGRKKPTGGK